MSLLAEQVQANQRIRWWQWPNVLALDAALVGMGWLILVARGLELDATLAPVAPWVMGLSIWLVYMADRWLDVRGLPLDAILTVRHRLMKRVGKRLLPVWCALLLADCVLALGGLSGWTIEDGIVLFVVCCAHTVLAQRRYFRLPLKEVVVGMVFGGSLLVFLWGNALFYYLPLSVSSDKVLLALCSLLFGILCFANCALIAERERDVDQALGRASIATRFPGRGRVWAAVAVLAGLLGWRLIPDDMPALPLAFAICGMLLGLLGVLRESFPVEIFRVLADTVMLLPWLLLVTPWL